MSDPIDPRLAWLKQFDKPSDGGKDFRRVSGGSRFIPSNPGYDMVLAFAPALATMGGIQSVNASALILGPDARRALDQDRAVVAAQNDGFTALVTALRQSPLTGCTSVMDLALSSSGWNPIDPRQIGNHEGFARYVHDLAATPFFNAPSFGNNELNLQAFPNPQAMVGAIASAMPGITDRDQQRVVNAILSLSHNVFGQGGDNIHADAQATLFAQQALTVGNQDIVANLYWCQVIMHYEKHTNKSSVSVSSQSLFRVEHVWLTFPTSRWAAYAEEVAKRKVTAVDEWLKQNSTT